MAQLKTPATPAPLAPETPPMVEEDDPDCNISEGEALPLINATKEPIDLIDMQKREEKPEPIEELP